MGRKKQFDETQVLDAAMHLFWQRGYEATTFAALEQLTGVSSRSLINCYGDKESLYSKAMDAYVSMAETILADLFSDPGIEAIENFFRHIEQAPPGSSGHFGCLVCNTIFEKEYSNPKFAAIVERFRNLLIREFKRNLEAARIPEATARATFLVHHFWGAMAEIRRFGSTQITAETNRILEATIKRWSE